MKAKEENKIKHVVSSRWFLVIALVVAVFFVFIFARAYYQDYKVRKEIEFMKEEIKNLETKKIDLLNLYNYVVSDNFVEEKARMELNMKQPGENVIVFDNVDYFDKKNSSKKENEKNTLKNYIKWWYYFIHKEINY